MLRKHLEWCRHAPETTEERAVARKLNKEVKKRTKLVFQRAGKAGHDLELPECEALALEEVLLKRCRDEELKVDAERRKAADAHYNEVKRAEEEAKAEALKNVSRVQENAVRSIQRMVSLHGCRLELRRRAFDRFEKKYDVASMAYYYRDGKAKTTTWRKPYPRGRAEIVSIEQLR